MKKAFTTLLKGVALFVALFTFDKASAQSGYERDNEIFRLGIEARFDYLDQTYAGVRNNAASGFQVRYFNMRLDGQITPKFTYSWRQRFSKVNSFADFVNNTDWFHLTYRPTQNWAISAGKQVVMIGGWEYDRAPIDVYFCSEYWNNVNCFQLGASVAYTTNEGNDTITLQVSQSPYDTRDTDFYAYNLYWMGSHGFYTALHSLNFSQYAPGKYEAYVVLGNQFKFGDATIQLDLMNRGTSARELLFDNFSIMGEVDYLIADRVNLFAKVAHDHVGERSMNQMYLCHGTNVTRVGGGVEYYPLGGKGNRDVRLHAAYAYTLGENTNPNGTAVKDYGFLSVGLTWRIDVMSAFEKIVNKVADKRASKI